MAKVHIQSEKLTPFGGIFSIMETFDSMLSPIIDSTLGQRCSSIISNQFISKATGETMLFRRTLTCPLSRLTCPLYRRVKSR